MPAKHKTGSKASSRSAALAARSSRSYNGMSSCTAQDFRQDSSTLQVYSQMETFIAQPGSQRLSPMDGYSYNASAYAPDLSIMADCRSSLLPEDHSCEPVDSWNSSVPSEISALDDYQPDWNQSYSHSGSSASSIDAMAIDSGLDASISAIQHFSDSSAPLESISPFGNDYSSTGFGYDSDSPFITPPLSPPEDGTSQDLVGCRGSGEVDHVFETCRGQPQMPPSPPFSGHDAHHSFEPMSTSVYQSIDRSARDQRHQSNSPLSLSGSSSNSIHVSGRGSVYSSRPAQRALQPAPPKSRTYSQESDDAASAGQTNHKEKSGVPQPRSHQFYKAPPGPDGRYTCPFALETKCSHKPTKQKCGYDKYLDSHLRPYLCKQAGCEEIKFSSNACLFRHEREAHAMHFYGKNPHTCHYSGCDRATEGFPRRWNLNDHMRRVHKHPQGMDTDGYDEGEISSKKKGSGAPSSQQMKRAASSKTKARVASATHSRNQYDQTDMYYTSRSSQRGHFDAAPNFVYSADSMDYTTGAIHAMNSYPYTDLAPAMTVNYGYA